MNTARDVADDTDDTVGASAGRRGLLVTLVLGLGFAIAAALLVPWRFLPDTASWPDLDPARWFDPHRLARIEDYAGGRRLLSWSSYLLGLVISLLLGFTKAGSALVRRLPGPWAVKVALAAAAVLAVAELLTLPFAVLLRQGALEVGVATGSWGLWARDILVGFGVNWVTTAGLLLVLTGLARLRPRDWPGWAAAAAAILVVATSYGWPVLVEPLFNRFHALPPGALRTAVFDLAERERVPIEEVLVSDASRRTTAVNAYVSGFGQTRRVVLWDTLVEDLPAAEAESVVAHELAHAKYDDVGVGTGLGALGAAAGVGLLGWLLTRRRLLDRAGAHGATDPAVVPLLLALLALGSVLASPVQATISRAIEARADHTALVATEDPQALVALQVELADRAWSDPQPPGFLQFWFGSHPTTMQRIAMARSFAARHPEAAQHDGRR